MRQASQYFSLDNEPFTVISRAEKYWKMYKVVVVFKGKQNHVGKMSNCD